MFEELEHTGEAAFRIWGKSLDELVRYSAEALFYLYFGKRLEDIHPTSENLHSRQIVAEGIDFGDALVSFLNELIYLFDTQRLVFRQISSVSFQDDVSKMIVDVLFDYSEHYVPLNYVKAATRSGADLKIEKSNSQTLYFITIIFDI